MILLTLRAVEVRAVALSADSRWNEFTTLVQEFFVAEQRDCSTASERARPGRRTRKVPTGSAVAAGVGRGGDWNGKVPDAGPAAGGPIEHAICVNHRPHRLSDAGVRRSRAGVPQHGDPSLVNARHALLDLAQAESSQSGALDHVAKAVALLVQAGQRTTSPDDASFAETFVAKLSRVPERVARESIERARRAGVDPQVISKAESALEAGSTAFDEGRFLDAIAGYSSRSIPI